MQEQSTNAAIKRANILGVGVDIVTMNEALNVVMHFIEARENALVATANAEMIMRATHDSELMTVLRSANLVVPDGAGTVWAANFLGYKMKERVAGYDLVQELLAKSASMGYKIYFLGSAPTVALRAKEKAETLYKGIEIVGVQDGYFKETDEERIIADIKAKRPDALLVALGVPKQEKWLYKYQKELNIPVSIGIGGTFDVMAGVMKRAPRFMQRAKLEWLFRGLMQPKRAGRLMALPKFVLQVYASKKRH